MKLKIRPSFILYGLCLIFLNQLPFFINLALALLVHELGHIIMLNLYDIKIKELTVSAIGGVMRTNINENSRIWVEFLIYLMGPLLNLVLGLICLYLNYKLFAYINLSLFLFNILPIYPLDGYYISLAFVSSLSTYKKSLIILKILSTTFCIIFILFSLHLNLYLVILSLYILILNIKNDLNRNEYHLFLLAKYLYPDKRLKNKKIKDIDLNLTKFYKGKNNYYIMNSKIYSEKVLLDRYFKT